MICRSPLLVVFTLVPWLFCHPAACQEKELANMAKAIEKKFGVQIAYDYDASAFFPKQWLEAPISAEGSQIALTEVERMLPIIDRFLSSYPEAVLKKNLKAIYLLNELKFYGKSYGGTNSNTAIYRKRPLNC